MAVGVAMEGWEIIHAIVVWAKRKIRDKRHHTELRKISPVGEYSFTRESYRGEPAWLNRLLRVGLIVVVVGVVAEWKYGAKLEDAHNAIHAYDVSKLEAADEKAGEAAASAATAREDAKAAKTISSDAETKARSAIAETGRLETKNAELSMNLAREQSHLEVVEVKRAKLEQSLRDMGICSAPRVLPQWAYTTLKALHGTPVAIEYVKYDGESRRAAKSIENAVTLAKWNLVRTTPVEDLPDGVEVSPYAGDEDTFGAHLQANDVAKYVLSFLHSYDWRASQGWILDANGGLVRDSSVVPPGGIRIRVGLYPAVSFVTPPGSEEMVARAAQATQQINEWREKLRQKALEEQDNKLTPAERASVRALRVQEDKKYELELARWNEPCHLVTPLSP